MSASSSSNTFVHLFARRGTSPFGQGVILFFALLAMLLLIPLVLIGAAGAVVTFGVLRAKAWLSRSRQPNGVLDGRRNVRVRLPESGGQEV